MAGGGSQGRVMGLSGQRLSVHIFSALKVELGQNLRQELIKRTPKKRPLRGEQRTPSVTYFSMSTGLSETGRSWQVRVIRSTQLAAWPGEGLELRCSWRPGYALERRKTNSFEGRRTGWRLPPPVTVSGREGSGLFVSLLFHGFLMCLAHTAFRYQNKRSLLRWVLYADGKISRAFPLLRRPTLPCPNLTHPRTVKAAALFTGS